jgi:hypothetical protein
VAGDHYDQLPQAELLSRIDAEALPQLLGMSFLAPVNISRGITTIRSSTPQVAVWGSRFVNASVMSHPMIAKSPFINSQMSGQPAVDSDLAPWV